MWLERGRYSTFPFNAVLFRLLYHSSRLLNIDLKTLRSTFITAVVQDLFALYMHKMKSTSPGPNHITWKQVPTNISVAYFQVMSSESRWELLMAAQKGKNKIAEKRTADLVWLPVWRYLCKTGSW